MNTAELNHSLKISAIMATRMLGLFILFPIFSIYADKYNASPIIIGVVLGIYGITQAILQIPFGYLSDKYGRKPLIIFGLILFFIGSIVAAQENSITSLIIGRALQGMGAISAVLMASVADFVAEDNLVKANAIIGMQIGFAFVLAIIIAPSLGFYLSLSGVFYFIAALALIALVIAIKIPENKAIIKCYPISWLNIKRVISKKLMPIYLSIYLLHLILSANFIALPLMIIEQIPLQHNWYIYLPVMLIAFIFMLPFIIIANKYKKIPLVLIISIIVLSIVEFLFYKLTEPSLINIIVLLSIFFIFFNILEATLPSLVAKFSQKNKKGMSMGVFSTAQFLGIFSGSMLGGLTYAIYQLNTIFLFLAIIGLVWALIIFLFKNFIEEKPIIINNV